MRITLAYGLLVAALAWMPYGLIHQGQRTVNPRAESILGRLANRCDPTTAEWLGCR